ncbi:MAG: hypothetical protein V7K46_02525 [Nostoc sp.]
MDWALVLSDLYRANARASRREVEVSRKACGIATLRAQPLQELYKALDKILLSTGSTIAIR